MIGAALLLAAAAAVGVPAFSPEQLPSLPAQGLVVSSADGVSLVDLRGSALGRLDGLRFAPENTFGAGLPRFKDAHGRFWRLDRNRRRLVPADAGQPLYGGATLSFVARTRTWLVRRKDGRILLRLRVRPNARRQLFDVSEDRDVVTTARGAFDLRVGKFFSVPPLCNVGGGRRPHWIILCGTRRYQSILPRTIEELVNGRRRLLVGPPAKRPAPDIPPVGHWAAIRLSPDGQTLLAQWSAECEVPQAYLVSRTSRTVRRIGGASAESIALGWAADGRALVHFPSGVCGGTYHEGPGVYVIGAGKPRLVVAASGRARVAMWGG